MYLLRGKVLLALFLIALLVLPEADSDPKRKRKNRKKKKKFIMKKKERTLLKGFLKRVAKANGVSNAQFAKDQKSGKVYTPPIKEDDTEFARNKKIIDQVFETDIVLTKKQLKRLIRGFKKRGNGRVKRKVIAQKSQRWERNIPYSITIPEADAQTAIKTGIRRWEEETCLRFVGRTNQRNYMRFFRGDGCYSYIGKIGGAQPISIGYRCETEGIAAHEIGHALGFWHEQSRADRDAYVVVNTNNILSAKIGNFELRDDSKDYGIPYDMGSLMHYGPSYFVTASGLRSIDSRDPNYSQTFGQRKGLSFIDVKLINAAYCSNDCPRKLNCKNGGYTDPKDCKKCRCPAGLSGDCSRAALSPGCGGDISVDTLWKTISSPRLFPNQNCYWHLKSSNEGRIEIEISRLSYPCPTTCRSFVELKTNDDFQQTGFRFCCRSPSRMFSATSEVVIIHETDSEADSRYSGFSLRVRSVGGSSSSVRPPVITPRPTRRPTTEGSAQWGEWGAWSRCSEECGGCGISQRDRRCNGADCRGGRSTERSWCNQQPCQAPTVQSCRVSSSVNCRFSGSISSSGSVSSSGTQISKTVTTGPGWVCEKVTSAPCSTGTLPNNGCCTGFKLVTSTCVKM